MKTKSVFYNIKLFCVLVLLACVTAIFSSCAKRATEIFVHDENAAQKILGIWQNNLTFDTEINLQVSDNETAKGVVRYTSATSFEFLKDGTFVQNISQEFQKFTPLDDIAENVDIAEIEKYFSKKSLLSGKYKINESHIFYELETISIDGDAEMPYSEFLKNASGTLPRKISKEETSFAIKYELRQSGETANSDTTSATPDELVLYAESEIAESVTYKRMN